MNKREKIYLNYVLFWLKFIRAMSVEHMMIEAQTNVEYIHYEDDAEFIIENMEYFKQLAIKIKLMRREYNEPRNGDVS